MCRQELLLLDNELSFNEAMIEEREQGIREVQEQIGQANEIFKDLAVLVHEQGVVIGKLPTTQKTNYSCCHPWIFLPLFHFLISFVTTDDIQSNVGGSSAATTQARVQLAKASKSAKSKSSWVSSTSTLLSSSIKSQFLDCHTFGEVGFVDMSLLAIVEVLFFILRKKTFQALYSRFELQFIVIQYPHAFSIWHEMPRNFVCMDNQTGRIIGLN
jgi:hypothetical protein